MSMSDLESLKRYVQSNETGMRQAESTVLLHVKHSNLQANFHEIRFDMHVSGDARRARRGAPEVPVPPRGSGAPLRPRARWRCVLIAPPGPQMLVSDVKHKLSTMCGTPAAVMTLQLKDEHNKVLSTLYEDSRPLGYYSPYSGCAGRRRAAARWPGRRRLLRRPPRRPSPSPQLHALHHRQRPHVAQRWRLAGGREQGGEVRDE